MDNYIVCEDHPNSIIKLPDNHEASEVCVECGKISSVQNYYSQVNQNLVNLPINKITKKKNQ